LLPTQRPDEHQDDMHLTGGIAQRSCAWLGDVRLTLTRPICGQKERIQHLGIFGTMSIIHARQQVTLTVSRWFPNS